MEDDMQISINGAEIREDIPGDNLEDILIHLRQRHLNDDHAVSQVLVNGVQYSEDMPHAAMEVDRASIQTLELSTLTPEDIAEHFLHNGAALINALLGSLPQITEMFRLGDEAEANEHFLRFLESLHLLISMLDKVGSVLEVKYNLQVGDQGSLNERLQRLAGSLEQLLDIQEQSDWVYLADILEYELTPDLEDLSRYFPNIQTAH
jgi:hypothetical protein